MRKQWIPGHFHLRKAIYASTWLALLCCERLTCHCESSSILVKPVSKLPTADQAGLPANVLKRRWTRQWQVRWIEMKQPQAKVVRREYTLHTFTPEDRAMIGRYAAENGNAVAVKKFKVTHSVGESTVKLFWNLEDENSILLNDFKNWNQSQRQNQKMLGVMLNFGTLLSPCSEHLGSH